VCMWWYGSWYVHKYFSSCLLVNGVSAAPVVPWSQSRQEEKHPDKWSKTYTHRDRSMSPMKPLTNNLTSPVSSVSAASPTKRFPRPTSNSNVSDPLLNSRVSAHIASVASQNRPPSPLKYSSSLPDPDSDILPSLAHHDATLSKVYGSVLQPKESLTTHSCAICSFAFPPDATIYPDPTVAGSSRFLCRPCFTINGGSRGLCGACSRPVLILKSEGGFVEAAQKYWHKQCFNCLGCSKNIGDFPMLDLFGNPSCSECFDSCLKRGLSTPKKRSPSDRILTTCKVNNIGGMNFNTNGQKSGEGSPAIAELEQRLGITTSREGSPAPEELGQRLSMMEKEVSTRNPASGIPIGRPLMLRENISLVEQPRSNRHSKLSESPTPRYYSPIRGQTTGSPAPTQEAIEEMKHRFLKESPYSSASRTSASTDHADPPSIIPLHSSRSSTSRSTRPSFTDSSSLFDEAPASPLSPTIPQTPDLISDTTTQSSSSGPDSPPRNEEDFKELSPLPNLEQGSYYIPHNVSHTLERLAEEATPNAITSPTHTPKSFRSYHHTSSFPPMITTTTTDITGHPSVKPIPLRSVDELAISPSNTIELTSSTRCAGCGRHLFSVKEGGRFVTVPNDVGNSQTLTYHTDCFRCVECDGVFKQTNSSQAVFLKLQNGPCHVEVRLFVFSREILPITYRSAHQPRRS
jgi:LIM domain